MALATRVIIVHRRSEYEELLARHASYGQAEFFLRSRGRSMDDVVARHEAVEAAMQTVSTSLPDEVRQGRVERADLDRYLFAPEDVVVAIGQDGLVANVAKYLSGQPVLGINPSPDLYDGVLVRVPLDRLASLLPPSAAGEVDAEHRTMVEAVLDGGERLLALNEIFIGHRSHQSARYRLRIEEREERQSSSGIIVATGTGATGWARSISRERNLQLDLDARSHRLAVLVREAFPAPGFGTQLTAAMVDDGVVSATSEMSDGGVIFGDGIESDFLRFGWGRRVDLRAANVPLRLAAKQR